MIYRNTLKKYMYKNPAAGINAKIPKYGKYWVGIYLANKANPNLVGMHPNKNIKYLFCKLFIIIIN